MSAGVRRTMFAARRSVALIAALALSTAARADHEGIHAARTLATTDGGAIYRQICQGCHMSRAQGAVGAGRYPALSLDPKLASGRFVALTVLVGRRNMPAFGEKHAIGMFYVPATLDDAQIAIVVNYVRTHFGNRYRDPITAAEVRALDDDPSGRRPP